MIVFTPSVWRLVFLNVPDRNPETDNVVSVIEKQLEKAEVDQAPKSVHVTKFIGDVYKVTSGHTCPSKEAIASASDSPTDEKTSDEKAHKYRVFFRKADQSRNTS